MAKLVVVDGNSLLFRAYYATAYTNMGIMRTSSGTPTNAIFAFSNMINSILKDVNEGDYFMVAFDTGKETFRHEALDTYKANRKAAPQELVEQFPISREMCKALGIFMFEEEGYEADDIAGTIAKIAEKEGIKSILYTSDRDYLQLVDDKISVDILKKGMSDTELYNEEKVIEKYGFGPEHIIDFKGLRGDASDNLKGIDGVGEKTASTLIQKYGDFDSIVKAMENEKGKVAEAIVREQEQGRMCRDLGLIRTDIDLPFTLEDTKYEGYSFSKIKEFCDKYELKTLLNRLVSKWKRNDEEDAFLLDDETKIDYKMVKEIGIAIDLEDEDDYYGSKIYGIGIYANDKNYYISVDELKNDENLIKILEDKNIKKYCYDYKSIKVSLSNIGINIDGLEFDILIASYILDTSLNKNKEHIFSYFGVNISGKTDENISLFDDPVNKEETCKVAYYSYKLCHKVLTDLSMVNALDLYNTLELPLVDTLANMEIEGFPLDVATLDEYGSDFKARSDALEKGIYDIVGHEFNINSPKQIATVLYDELGLKDKSGKASTSSEYLKEMTDQHPIIEKILDYRKYYKLYSTYTEGLKNHIRKDNKIHAQFNQALTQTGRLSSSHPNLQNIPIRDEEGKVIRKAVFYTDKNYEILTLDYSQIELRVLASMSGCQAMKDIFESGLDIHAEMSKKIFNLKGEPTEQQRRMAKTVNFGIIYGISDWGLADRLGIPLPMAKDIINNFYESFPEIREFFINVQAEADKKGYVSTLMNRRRYINTSIEPNFQVREFLKRAAVNAPIQGTAADLIKMAMVKCEKALKDNNLKTKMILQIHDELIFKVPKEEKDIVYPLLKDIMLNALKLDVPLEVKGGFGQTWYDAK
ncbi:MAG: DNA polymerase I [Coprobacillus sp.]|nr:DNA polymerase I [Coprobacillus sp.]